MKTRLKRLEPIEKKTLNLQEAYVYLGIGRSLLLSICKTGDLPYRKVGKFYLFTREALDNYLMGESVTNQSKEV